LYKFSKTTQEEYNTYEEEIYILTMWRKWETIEDDYYVSVYDIEDTNLSWWNKEHEAFIKVIGHPVIIWDVLDWAEKDSKYKLLWFTGWKTCADWCWYSWRDEFSWNVLWKRKLLRNTIDNQSDECIDYIYSLITK
jgi:hypothetical protein